MSKVFDTVNYDKLLSFYVPSTNLKDGKPTTSKVNKLTSIYAGHQIQVQDGRARSPSRRSTVTTWTSATSRTTHQNSESL